MLRGSAAWTYSAPSPAAPEQEPSICLTFRDHWIPPLNTKSFSFNNILRSDALTLENLRELTACRAQAYESTTVTADERLSWIQRYYALLNNFGSKAAAMDGNNEEALQFEWTSPLGGLPATYHRVKGVVAEQAMACVTYAAALERQAYSLAAEIAQHDMAQLKSMPEQHVAAAGLFRRAAGVYEYAADEYVDQLTSPRQADRPAELRQGMPSVLSKLALGQAQAITAHRAQVKGTSPAVLASLYCGAVGLFEEAAHQIRSNDDLKQASECLRKALALSSSYNTVKAWQAMAAQEAAESNLGVACANLQEAKKLAQESCQVAQGKPDWQQLFQNELSLISDLMIVYDRERQIVYFQAIAQHLSKLPQGHAVRLLDVVGAS
ncbi:hypothetical protein WJX82_010086 [Trebouxia sp. C0006]